MTQTFNQTAAKARRAHGGHIAARVAIVCMALMVNSANARDSGQWQYEAPDIRDYYRSLKQPDNDTMSCCGEADAYYADEQETDAYGNTVAIITDTRPDEPRQRPHIDVGTKFVIPADKIRKPPIFNPTDHTIIFISPTQQKVYCYEPMGLY